MSNELMAGRALESNSFQVTTASASTINPQVWLRQIVDFAKAKVVMEPLGKRIMDIFGQAGSQVNEQFNVEISASELTESTAITPSAISYTQVIYTPVEYGVAVALTRKESVRPIQDIMAEKTQDMGFALAKKRDQVILSSTVLGSSTITTVTPNGVAVSAIASSDVLGTDEIANAITKVRAADYEPKFLVIHPNQENNLLKLSDFIDSSVYGGREVVLNGEIGRYLGLRVLITTLIPENADKSTAKDAYVLDQDAFGIAWKMGTTFNSDYKVLEREFLLAAVEDYGVALRIAGKAARITSYAVV